MNNRSFSFEEKKIADQVADDLLTVNDKEDRRYFILLLLLLICLIFLVSSLSFAVFDTYYNGSRDNSTDVHINVNPDDDDKDKDNDEDEGKYEDKDEDWDDYEEDDDITNDVVKPSHGQISDGKIYFSYNTGSNYIDMDGVYPLHDNLGKVLTGDKQYFDFNIESSFSKNKKKKKLVYEISIVPTDGNTIPGDEVRVYLTENDKSVSVLEDEVSNFSDLPDSKYQENGKVIYRKTVNENYSADYIFRMWLSYDADVTKEVRKFSCKIAVDAYEI